MPIPTLADELERAAAARAALRRFLRRTEDASAAAGLSAARYNLLLALKAAAARGRALNVTDLVELLQLPQPSVSELVRRAEADGLVRRVRGDADRRTVAVELTREGGRRLMRAFRALRRDRHELARAFDELAERFRDERR